MNQLLDVSDINKVKFTAVSFIDDIVGLGEKKIAVNIEHFSRVDLEHDRVELVIDRKSLSDYMEERNAVLLKHENYPEFDHANSMLVMLEYDFNSIDKIKLFYKGADNLSGEYVIDTSDGDRVDMESVSRDGELVLKVRSK